MFEDYNEALASSLGGVGADDELFSVKLHLNTGAITIITELSVTGVLAILNDVNGTPSSETLTPVATDEVETGTFVLNPASVVFAEVL